jgi:hypothetical protein
MDELKSEMPDGHVEAMRELARDLAENDHGFLSWQQRIKQKEEQKKFPQPAYKPTKNHCSWSVSKQVEERWKPPTTDEGFHVPVRPKKQKRFEEFSPPPELKAVYQKKGLAFTVGKKYPIHAELPELNTRAGMRYITEDDNGNRRSVNSVHFNPLPNLQWRDVIDDEMVKKWGVTGHRGSVADAAPKKKFKGKFQEAGKINKQGRMYPADVLEEVFNSSKKHNERKQRLEQIRKEIYGRD